MAELKAAGASWIQLDEPTLVKDLDSHQLQAFTHAYSELESSFSGLNVLIETYFADIPAEAYKTLTSLKGVSGYGFDLVRGAKTLDLIKAEFPSGKFLFAGVVDGRNIWANDLASSLSTLHELEGIAGKGVLSFKFVLFCFGKVVVCPTQVLICFYLFLFCRQACCLNLMLTSSHCCGSRE